MNNAIELSILEQEETMVISCDTLQELKKVRLLHEHPIVLSTCRSEHSIFPLK
jgi:hypothetical protein